MVVRKGRSPKEPVRYAADTDEQPLGIDAQAVESSSTPSEDADETEASILGDGANHIPLNERAGNPAREPDVPGFVPVDATEDRGDDWFSREGAIGLQQRGKDHTNREIKGCDRGEVQPDIDLSDAVVETKQGPAQLPVRRGCWQCVAQFPQQPLMNELLFCDVRKCTASNVLEGQISETCEGEQRRFLAAGENLQQFRQCLGLRISEPERSGQRRGGNRVGEPKADLAVD